MAGGVKPAVRAEEHGVVEVLGVVGNSPATCVELGLYGKKNPNQKHIFKRGLFSFVENQNLPEEGPSLWGG